MFRIRYWSESDTSLINWDAGRKMRLIKNGNGIMRRMNSKQWLFLSNHSCWSVVTSKNGEQREGKLYIFILQEVVTNCVVFICHNSEKWNQDTKRGTNLTVSHMSRQEVQVCYANFWCPFLMTALSDNFLNIQRICHKVNISCVRSLIGGHFQVMSSTFHKSK